MPIADEGLAASMRAAARQALAELPPSKTGRVDYASAGAVLVLGEATRALPVAQVLKQTLKVVAVVTGPVKLDKQPPGMVFAPGRVVRITGHLGRFKASAEGPEGELDLSVLSPNRNGWFDLVIDLGAHPLIRHQIQPLGYFAPGMDETDLKRVLQEAPRWVGSHSKPRYVTLDPERCTHRRQGITGCTRCIRVCPAGALTSGERAARFDPYLCQGCGGCAGVCPSGAIVYAAQPATEVRCRIRRVVEALRESGNGGFWLLLHDDDISEGFLEIRFRNATSPVIPLAIRSVAAVGVDLWLYALALGVQRVELMPNPHSPPMRMELLRAQEHLARQLLAGMAVEPQRIALISDPQIRSGPGLPRFGQSDRLPDEFMKGNGPVALQVVLERLRGDGPEPPEEIGLPEGAPLGGVRLDTTDCTLCMACTQLCPTQALRRGEVGTSLQFNEGACVQCGLCQAGCPERAIRLTPRLLTAAGARSGFVTLMEAESAVCAVCGGPFLTQSLLRAAAARVQDNPMFAGRLDELLGACPPCRAKASLAAQLPARSGPHSPATKCEDDK